MRRFRGCLLVVSLVLYASLTFAQSATIHGSVSDKSGAKIPGAHVVLTSMATNAMREMDTNQQGAFEFLSLNPGGYSLHVSSEGFRPVKAEGLQLLVNTPSTLNLQMEVASVAQQVVVQAEVELLNAEDATLGNAFDEHQVRQLPLEARNVLDLLQLQAGVTATGEANGARNDQTNVTLDGIDVNDQETQASLNTVLRVPLDSLQEFRVTTTNPNSDQGSSSGAQVAMITKSGSNAIHGSAFDFLRRTATSANSYARKAAGFTKPEQLDWNDYGGSLGGPIAKERLFYFVNYERFHQYSELTATRNVPSDTLRQGILRYSNTGGGISALSSAQIQAIDPLSLGVNPAMLSLLQAYPHCNGTGCQQGADLGVNFASFTFSSLVNQLQNTGVLRLDYNLTANGRQTVYFRGTYMGDNEESSPPQFPGQPTLDRRLNRSKGFVAAWTGTFGNHWVNDFRYGLTRQSVAFGGGSNPDLSFSNSIIDAPVSALRGLQRVVPVHNFVDSANWIHGKHTLNFGTNLRLVTNSRQDSGPAFPAAIIDLDYAGQIGSLDSAIATQGGGAIDPSVLRATRNAVLILFGGLTEFTNTYQFDKTGTALPTGTPLIRSFKSNSYDFFATDSWQVAPNLRLTYGLRYGYDSVPYETHGLQTATNIDLESYLRQRIADQAAGIPYSSAPLVGFVLAGKANNGPGLWQSHSKNFSPRVSFAYSPQPREGMWSRILGAKDRSSIRGGFTLTYDRLNNSIVVNNSNDATFGLASPSINGAGSYSYGTAPRFTGLNSIPNLAPLVSASPFPVTPPSSGLGTLTPTGVIRSLQTPYSMSMDLSVQRDLGHNFSLETAYVGRFGRRLLVKQDIAQPYLYFKDKQSGQTFADGINQVRPFLDGKVPTPPAVSFFDNLFAPGAPAGTGTQLALNCFNGFAFGPTDYTSFPAGCNDASVLGPGAFFNGQFQTYPVWTNAGTSNYNALQVIFRKHMSSYTQFDVNYTYSKSLDNGSPTGRATFFGGSVQNGFQPQAFYAVSDFDQPHQLNANWILQLPVGRKGLIGAGMGRAADAFLGGWQLGGIFLIGSGTPVNVTNTNFPTNFQFRGIADQVARVHSHVKHKGAGGLPNLFGDPNAAISDFAEAGPGSSGARNVLRNERVFNLDISLGKTFRITEKKSLQFRWEAFNATNSVFFSDPSLSLSRPAEFGLLRASSNPRRMQFGFRFDF